MTAEIKRRPGGRTERIRVAVANAVLELIRARGLDFEIQEVAKVAGVGRATLFRRWPDRGSLISEALAEHVARFSVEPTGNWKEDFYDAARRLREFFRDPTETALNKVLLATNNQVFQEKMLEYWQPIIDAIWAPMEQAQRLGKIAPEVDVPVIIETMMVVLMMDSLMGRYPQLENFTDRLIDQILRGVPEL